MKLCQCGCGTPLKNKSNRFINGHSHKGKKHSKSHKEKISKSLKGRIFSKETCNRISESLKGKKHTEERKSHLSEMKKGKPAWNSGKKMSKKWKKNHPGSNFWLGKKHSINTRMKMRLATINRIEKQRLNGEPLIPAIGETEREFLNEIENILNLQILRQFSIRGYFIDGYSHELNLAFEFDELNNHQNLKKDLERQKEIEGALNCSFFRVTDLEWKNNKKEIINQIKRIRNV